MRDSLSLIVESIGSMLSDAAGGSVMVYDAVLLQPYGSVIEYVTIDDCYDVLLKAYLEAVRKPDFVETVRKVMAVERLIALRKEQTENL